MELNSELPVNNIMNNNTDNHQDYNRIQNNQINIQSLLINHKINKQLQLLEAHYNIKLSQVKTIMYDFYSLTQTIAQIRSDYLPNNKTISIRLMKSPLINSNRSTSVDQSFRRSMAKDKDNPNTSTNNKNKFKQNFYLPQVTIDIDSRPSKTKFVRSLSRRSTNTKLSTTPKLLSQSLKNDPFGGTHSSKAFKFEPKKRNLSLTQLYTNSNEIGIGIGIDNTSIELNSMRLVNTTISPKSNKTIGYGIIFSESKYERIHRSIMLFLGKDNNTMKNINKHTRKVYLLNVIDTLQQKIASSDSSSVSTSNNAPDQIEDKIKLMEKEVLIHNKTVLISYLNRYSN